MASTAIFLVLTPQALAADAADFSNNLFSDLAPLLTLFGDQVAKQFMSQSFTWLEDVIFAMAPLGIITAITSAVRVGGPNWLKAVVGRARESRAVAEVELMSSTSHEVCELWGGKALVRVMGSPKVAEILYFEGEAGGGVDASKLFTLKTAIKDKKLRGAKGGWGGNWTQMVGAAYTRKAFLGGAADGIVSLLDRTVLKISSGGLLAHFVPAGAGAENPISGLRRRLEGWFQHGPPEDPALASSPNISLNFREAKKRGELWLFAILGIVLQFGSLIFIGVTRYHKKVNLKEDENSEFAYPLMAFGTLLLVAGMMACSHVVQASSKERKWVAESDFRIVWLQKSGRVNDQHFGSYALFGHRERKKHITSRPKAYTSSLQAPGLIEYAFHTTFSLSNLAMVGSFVGIAGFVIQFVGIRALHWSASISQLVVTLAMTVARTWIRRNMSARPRAMILPVGYEIDWLAVRFGMPGENLWGPREPQFEQNGSESDQDDNLSWDVMTLHGYLGYRAAHEEHLGAANDAKKILSVRAGLGRLTEWEGISDRFARELISCLRSLLNDFTNLKDITRSDDFPTSETFHWALPVKVGGLVKYITMTARRSIDNAEYPGQWSVDEFELCAVVSLWCYRMKERGLALMDTPDTTGLFWHHGGEVPTVLRVLGPATNRFMNECRRWMDIGGRFEVVENGGLEENPIGGPTTVEVNEFPKVLVRVGHCTAKSSRQHITPHHIVGTKPIDHDGCRESFAFLSMTPLRQIFAQEILSSFLWAIADTVRSIDGKTRFRDHETTAGEGLDSRLENPFFQKLAETITESKLASNIQDAYALIITPFVTADKLPPMPSSN
ncbi:unnamed protein product [Tuber aestivum]|uniref:Uncharacterized protein n=1 Tax=Tuber aestivum TaxID=59557 RepID=A0A292Q2T4_9PEZI|nr:unnamed protein product [Tuber aestivum]